MCGIAGIINFKGASIAPSLLEKACSRLAHRGPDSRGQWRSNGQVLSVGLTHTRLAVIDPRPEGRQPMVDVSGRFIIVFNGMIYNYRELRQSLQDSGYRFNTATDTEVILNGYAHWGEAVLDRLQGMWAFCIYDTEYRAGLLCRDRFGIKPLVYSLANGEIAFASEMKALEVLSSAPQEISSSSVHHYLRFGYIPHPDSIYKSFYKLPPGQMLRFDNQGAHEPSRYYTLEADTDANNLTYEDACVELRSRICKSVQSRTVSDVPLGSFLSGGLDSSIVVSHLSRDLGLRPQTFSIGYKDQPRYDETSYANLIATTFDTNHHEFLLGFDEVLEHLPVMLDHMGEPFADASLLPTSLVSAQTRRQVTVALSGDGADELFGGYYRYLGHHYLNQYLRIPRLLRSGLLEPLAKVLPTSKSRLIGNQVRQAKKLLRGQSSNPLQRHLSWSRIHSPQAEELLDPEKQMCERRNSPIGSSNPIFFRFKTCAGSTSL